MNITNTSYPVRFSLEQPLPAKPFCVPGEQTCFNNNNMCPLSDITKLPKYNFSYVEDDLLRTAFSFENKNWCSARTIEDVCSATKKLASNSIYREILERHAISEGYNREQFKQILKEEQWKWCNPSQQAKLVVISCMGKLFLGLFDILKLGYKMNPKIECSMKRSESKPGEVEMVCE